MSKVAYSGHVRLTNQGLLHLHVTYIALTYSASSVCCLSKVNFVFCFFVLLGRRGAFTTLIATLTSCRRLP